VVINSHFPIWEKCCNVNPVYITKAYWQASIVAQPVVLGTGRRRVVDQRLTVTCLLPVKELFVPIR
jgi:hypothetical protein